MDSGEFSACFVAIGFGPELKGQDRFLPFLAHSFSFCLFPHFEEVVSLFSDWLLLFSNESGGMIGVVLVDASSCSDPYEHFHGDGVRLLDGQEILALIGSCHDVPAVLRRESSRTIFESCDLHVCVII